jgi:ribose 1,5-bisphosphokinase
MEPWSTRDVMTKAPGVLVLVVGPSGAGKDSVMRGAAALLVDKERYVFPRRVVTRHADIETEDHDSMSEVEFASASARGNFMLSWHAHGHRYGIPKQVAGEISAGRIAVINVSRHILHEAVLNYPHLIVAEVTADTEVRIARIRNRGREQPDEAAKRAIRVTPLFPLGIKIIRIENNGAVEDAIAQFTHFLKQL